MDCRHRLNNGSKRATRLDWQSRKKDTTRIAGLLSRRLATFIWTLLYCCCLASDSSPMTIRVWCAQWMRFVPSLIAEDCCFDTILRTVCPVRRETLFLVLFGWSVVWPIKAAPNWHGLTI